jgi:hypothetical protein
MSSRVRLRRVQRRLDLSRSAVAAPPRFVVRFAGKTEEMLPSDEAQLDYKMIPRLANESQTGF